MAKRGVAKRGRVRIAIGLLAFLVVASGIIMRRSTGAAKARELHALDRTRANLESERAKLVNDIRNATSLSRIGPVVSQRLGLRTPPDSQLVRLPKPAARRGRSP